MNIWRCHVSSELHMNTWNESFVFYLWFYIFTCILYMIHHIWTHRHTPHENLFEIQKVLNLSSIKLRISTLAHIFVFQIRKYISSEWMVYIKQKGAYGVETPPRRTFCSGDCMIHDKWLFFNDTWLFFSGEHMTHDSYEYTYVFDEC